MGDVSEDNLVQ